MDGDDLNGISNFSFNFIHLVNINILKILLLFLYKNNYKILFILGCYYYLSLEIYDYASYYYTISVYAHYLQYWTSFAEKFLTKSQ